MSVEDQIKLTVEADTTKAKESLGQAKKALVDAERAGENAIIAVWKEILSLVVFTIIVAIAAFGAWSVIRGLLAH